MRPQLVSKTSPVKSSKAVQRSSGRVCLAYPSRKQPRKIRNMSWRGFAQGSRAARWGGFNRGFRRYGLVCPNLFFCPFWDFPIFAGFSRFVRGIFPIYPFPLSQPINSTYEEQSRKGPRHNFGAFPNPIWKHPGL